MFKKKVWKRGDKLNAKELNRIESGGLLPVITCDEEITKLNTDESAFSNFSVTAQELRNMMKNYQHIILEINVKQNEEKIAVLRTTSVWADGNELAFLLYASGMGLMVTSINAGKEHDNPIEINYKVILPDAD